MIIFFPLGYKSPDIRHCSILSIYVGRLSISRRHWGPYCNRDPREDHDFDNPLYPFLYRYSGGHERQSADHIYFLNSYSAPESTYPQNPLGALTQHVESVMTMSMSVKIGAKSSAIRAASREELGC